MKDNNFNLNKTYNVIITISIEIVVLQSII